MHGPSAQAAKVRLYDRLFNDSEPDGHDQPFTSFLNPDSLDVIENVLIEPELCKAKVGEHFQFLRKGYFCLDPDSSEKDLVFNRTVTLRDTWAKMAGKK